MKKDLIFVLISNDMREYDVTPQEQGSECVYQARCHFYKYGIWCNECTQRVDFDEIDIEDTE